MSFTFRPAIRENVPLLIGLAGGTGSGKTFSAMQIAKGLANGQRFCVIDTEAGRAKHYADLFEFDHGDLLPPFRPEAYADAIEAADKAGYPVIVIDSFSHEHAGDGGLLDWHESEFQRLGGKDSVKMTAWIKPKMAHRRMVSRLLQVRAHLILCFRAEEKVEIIDDPDKPGKKKIVPKRSFTGLDGWVPVSEKTLPYELTVSLLLMPIEGRRGQPLYIKVPEQLRPIIPEDKPLSEETGRLLGEWARGGTLSEPERKSGADADEPSADVFSRNQPASSGSESEWADEHQIPILLELAAKVSEQAHEKAMVAVMEERGKHDGRVRATWLARQVERAREKAGVAPEPEQSQFADLVPDSVKAS